MGDGRAGDRAQGDDEAEEEEEGERLQQEMGEVGEGAETVDERVWGEDDKPEEAGASPEQRRDAPVQACLPLQPSHLRPALPTPALQPGRNTLITAD